MNIKIQGGGSGTYANTGSCTGVTTYLQHEDLERMKNGREVQPFFNNSRDRKTEGLVQPAACCQLIRYK